MTINRRGFLWAVVAGVVGGVATKNMGVVASAVEPALPAIPVMSRVEAFERFHELVRHSAKAFADTLDAEGVRRSLVNEPWSIIGQSGMTDQFVVSLDADAYALPTWDLLVERYAKPTGAQLAHRMLDKKLTTMGRLPIPEGVNGSVYNYLNVERQVSMRGVCGQVFNVFTGEFDPMMRIDVIAGRPV